MSEAEFDGRDYAVGTVRGVRAFGVDKYGRLRGVTHRDIWAPGENTAVCHNEVPADGWRPVDIRYGTGTVYYSHSDKEGWTEHPPMRPVIDRPHTLAECSHGYYAYYDGSNDYQTDARISAVVEGYGEVLIGTRGFRAEKARLVALCIPDAAASDRPDLPRWTRLRRWTPRIVWSVATGGQMGAATYMWLHGSWFNGAWSTLAAAAMLFITGWRSGWIYKPEPDAAANLRALRLKYEGLSDESIPPAVYDMVRRNYPDVPIYSSFERMVSENPPDKGLTPSPDNDPNFWRNR